MISFITFKDAGEQLEVVADEQGINDLIFYLEAIKKERDHMHLTIDSEIMDYPVLREQKQVIIIKHVRIQYANSSEWKVSNSSK